QAKVKEGNIRFEHVCFSYDGKHPILDDISFSVNKGESDEQVQAELLTLGGTYHKMYSLQAGAMAYTL
ncbi:hypothetical protein, partial [Streptococcus pneumoniae]|uniref:hypothetical protein n=1 Tax=Streptococcus pneumoniae TaxID=1313 RepID=UPI000AB4D650